MKLRFVLAVAVVLGAVGTGVEASAQEDAPGDVRPTPTAPPPIEDAHPAPAPSADVGAPQPPRAATMDPDKARAYAAWQYQYGAWQYQYAAWLAAQQRQAQQPVRRWYGWKTLLSDGVSISVFSLGVAIASDSRRTEEIGVGLGVAGYLGFLALPPIIHLVHGNGGSAALSAGLRLGGTALIVLGALECGQSSRRCDAGYGILAGVGFLAYPVAVVVDAATASEEVSPVEETGLRITPWFTATRGGGAFGLRGAF